MRNGITGTGVLVLCAMLVGTTPARATEPEPPTGEGMPEMDPAKKAEMEAWMKASRPGEKHAMLEPMIGTWTAKSSFYGAPGHEPQVSEAKSVNAWSFGGRFVKTTYQGEAMGQPFDGEGYLGYDNIAQEFVSTWKDTMSTGIFLSTGQFDEAGKALTTTGTTKNPITGKDSPMRTVTRFEGPDRHVFEMYENGPDGKEFMSMSIEYTRVK